MVGKRLRSKLQLSATSVAWLCVLTMWLLLEAPDLFRNTGIELRHLRGSGDLLAMLTLAAASYRFRWARFVRVSVVIYAVVLVLFKIDRSIFRFVINEDPVLYDQLFMLQHLYVLIRDLWSAEIVGWLVGLALVLSVFALLGTFLVRRMTVLLGPSESGRTWQTLFIAWLLALAGTTTAALGLSRRPLVVFDSQDLAENIAKSLETQRALARGLAKSPYGNYGALELTRRPRVLLYVVESYGRRIWDRNDLRRKHSAVLTQLEQRLTAAGIESVSAFSASSIKGGRSWLANASLLVGAPVRFEAVYEHLSAHIEERPTLVTFFRKHGYQTVLVSPVDRPRAGLSVDNVYGYDRVIDYDAIDYRGPAVGWGVVPDQYSMGVVEDTLLRKATTPLFMNYHLVTSHAPWRDVPIKVADYRELSQGPKLEAPGPDAVAGALRRLTRHYTRDDSAMTIRPLSRRVLTGYLATIAYDLDLIVDQAVRLLDDDTLLIIIGDHQPPLIGVHDTNADSPIHVLARNPELLAEMKDRGFKPGLVLERRGGAALGHGGLFSLLVRTFVRYSGEGKPMPPFLKQGYDLMP